MSSDSASSSDRLLVLYHGGCRDGFCAAWVARKFHPDADFIPVHYGSKPPPVRGRNVLIVDFSYPRETLLQMKSEARRLEVIDHHKTAEEDLRGLDFCVFDMSKSGARLTWEWFFPHDPSPPWLVSYTEDRDLWAWKLPNSREVNAALRSYPLDFSVWDDLACEDAVKLMVTEGAAILREQDKVVASHVQCAYKVTIDGHTVLAVNATRHHSEIAGELAKGMPFGVCWFVDGNNRKIAVSLRSTDEGVDVSGVAKRRGGGGHRNSAGYSLLTSQINEIV